MQTIFFVELYSSEARKLVEHLINYVIYKVDTPKQLHLNKFVVWSFILCVFLTVLKGAER